MAPIDATPSFKHKAYAALKNAIVAMDIYRNRDDIRLDERKLAQDFGISRTPVREAMAQLESEGFVRLVPRRGIYVVRKTKREVIEMITAWARPTKSPACARCSRLSSTASCAPISTSIPTSTSNSTRPSSSSATIWC
jgi:DNA-binding GntR family transcriptional regulator